MDKNRVISVKCFVDFPPGTSLPHLIVLFITPWHSFQNIKIMNKTEPKKKEIERNHDFIVVARLRGVLTFLQLRCFLFYFWDMYVLAWRYGEGRGEVVCEKSRRGVKDI